LDRERVKKNISVTYEDYKTYKCTLSITCSQIPTEHIFTLRSAKKHYSTFPETGGRIISDGRTASVGRLLRRSSAMVASISSGFSLGFGVQSCKEKFAILMQQLSLTI
jgi:hypothetical protein